MAQPSLKALNLGLVEPKQAVAAFARRNLLLPSYRWQDVFQEEHLRGVAVAGVTKYDVLQVFADEMQASLERGGDLRAFSKRIQPALEKKGYWGDVEVTDPVTGEKRVTKFDDRRLQLIFDVNTRQSYASGSWDRIQANKARKPFIMYMTMRDERVRASHRQWDCLVLPVDDPFWQTHFPPNGWRCRCIAFAVDEKDIARYIAAGFNIKRDAPPVQEIEFTNTRTGAIEPVPRGVDPGFAYNPGVRPLAAVVPKELQPGEISWGRTPALHEAPRMPAPRKIDPADLLPPGLAEADYLAAFMSEFGLRDAVEFTDVAGEQLVISDELFRDIKGQSKIKKRGREQYVKLLARAIKEPDEIWMAEEHHHARDANVMRRRYIARFEIEGLPRPLLSVFEIGRDGWRGVTGYQAQDAESANSVLSSGRRGALVYRRV